ncbi:sushi domain-containing protein 2-like [Mercenaria mercenaria]|uniref:sushi domain-containing protein 2-like n=1 Tax=Mercenaria mercenaria TaxID=6596 RepID=UPI00234EE862|nr:sushi domain-containing protein 2-like [Mercenaria mercenaria]
MATSTHINLNGVYLSFVFISIQSTVGASPIFMLNGTYRARQINPSEHSTHLVNAPLPIIFKGKPYREFVISKDGLVVFTKDKSAFTYHAQDWTAANVAPSTDMPFIAPYYHNGQALDSLSGYTGHVFYRIIDSGKSNTRDKDLLFFGEYIREQVVGSANFSPTWGIVITWESVTSTPIIEAGRCRGTTVDPCPSNTFQLVILADGSQSYAIFNYGTMEMTPSTYDQAGFNGGSGTGFTDIVTKSQSIQQLNQAQGSDQVGRFIFKISPGKILRGGCSNDLAYTQLSVNPNYASMFGGKLIDISGPCFIRSQNIYCRFQDPNTMTYSPEGKAIYVSQTRVRCVVPQLLVRDRVILQLSTDDGHTYPYTTNFTIVFPGRMAGSEFVSTVSKPDEPGWRSHNPTSLSIAWNGSLLSNDRNSFVDIELIGYSETKNEVVYSNLATLGKNIPATSGQFTFDPRDIQCSGQTCYDYGVALVEVRLHEEYVPNSHRFLSTKAVPLGWYMQTAMTEEHGEEWPSKLCENWYNKASQDMKWVNSLLSCPCSLAQAISDFGRWQPDHGCNLQNADNPRNCFYHSAAVHCVRSVQPVNGAGNQCCYSGSGYLVFAADTFFGSTADKGHDWGAAPYGKPLHVPSLSHWVEDLVPLFQCCQWTNFSLCDNYVDLRPTTDCTGYNPPVPASVYGQGHIATFKGLKFRILGPGDYVLLRAGNTEVQARFQRNLFPTEKNQLTTYSLTAVAVQDRGTSDRVELRLRGPEFSNQYQHIDVFVNGQFMEFNEDSLKWQDFRGVAVINTDIREVKSNFTVLLTNGIGFQVADVAETLQLYLMMPSDTRKKTSGLLGDIDGTKTLPDGTLFSIKVNSPNELYNKFELAWAVDKNRKLFSDFLPANRTYEGQVNPTEKPGHISGFLSFCVIYQEKLSDECLFDYKFTGSENMARATRDAAVRYTELSTNLQPVRSCGLLNVPRSEKSNYRYTIGTNTTIIGCRTGSLSGTRSYTCLETSNVTQEWSPAVTATCEVVAKTTDTWMIGIAVVAGIVVVGIVLLVAFVVFVKLRKQDTIRSGVPKTEEETVAMNMAE